MRDANELHLEKRNGRANGFVRTLDLTKIAILRGGNCFIAFLVNPHKPLAKHRLNTGSSRRVNRGTDPRPGINRHGLIAFGLGCFWLLRFSRLSWLQVLPVLNGIVDVRQYSVD